MRLLIATQAVDTEDPALGFFVRWLEEFAKHAAHIEVICLKEGKHDSLPANVRVHSLGKENPPRLWRRLRYAIRFKLLAWRLRRNYETVFVHMNEEYVLLGGLLWRALGKRIVLWRNHKMGSWRTQLAVRLSHVACYTSPQAFIASYSKAVRMPVGIDTDAFMPPATLPPHNSILFLGRLDPVKKPEILLRALALLADRGVSFKANLYGSPTDPQASSVQSYMTLAAPLVARGVLTLSAGVSHNETAELYRSHAIYVNLTPSGSFDKTIGEAMASGSVVVVANDAVRGVVPDELIAGASAESTADALEKALSFSDGDREALGKKSRAYILQEHSLQMLVERLQPLLGNNHETIPQR